MIINNLERSLMGQNILTLPKFFPPTMTQHFKQQQNLHTTTPNQVPRKSSTPNLGHDDWAPSNDKSQIRIDRPVSPNTFELYDNGDGAGALLHSQPPTENHERK